MGSRATLIFFQRETPLAAEGIGSENVDFLEISSLSSTRFSNQPGKSMRFAGLFRARTTTLFAGS